MTDEAAAETQIRRLDHRRRPPASSHLVGPLWQRIVDGEHEYALVAQDKHHNRRGLVQGGLLMTFADRTCGMTARYRVRRPTLATVQLDTHFVEAAQIGDILISKPRVVRTTRSLIFMTTEVTAIIAVSSWPTACSRS